jgi:hypothetical protein
VKIFTVILSFYLLALNFTPCNDVAEDNDKNDVLIELSQNDCSNHDHNTSDLCSPFCLCHCCHVHTLDFVLNNFEPFQPSDFELSTIHFESHGKDISDSLFQPPRV